jgi:hypothetical protein
MSFHSEEGTIWVVAETFAAFGIAAIAVVLGLGIGALLWRWQHGQ